jgi:hypothetical protein
MTLTRPLAAIVVLACANASAAPATPEFHRFDAAEAAAVKSARAGKVAVPAPHKHVVKAVTRADGTVELTCAAETNPKFVAFERERLTTQEK